MVTLFMLIVASTFVFCIYSGKIKHCFHCLIVFEIFLLLFPLFTYSTLFQNYVFSSIVKLKYYLSAIAEVILHFKEI